MKCLEIARFQDFAPNTPELLGALSGPQTPRRKSTSLSDMVFAFSRSKIDVLQMVDLCTCRECSSCTTSQYLFVYSKHSIAPKDDERIHVISGENVNIYKTLGTQTRLPIKAKVCPRFPKTKHQFLVWSASSHGFVAIV